MMIPVEYVLAAAAIFLLLSILASKAAIRFGIPALLLFLLLGMLAGSDGLGKIHFDYPWVTQSISVLALAFILFSGGLDTHWHEVQSALRPGLALATVGVIITALSVGWFVTNFFGFTWIEGILLGAIISSTDAAAVFAVLRGQSVRLKGRLLPLLELESGSNDPMAIFLTIGMIELLMHPEESATSLIPLFILQMGIGLTFGYAMAKATLLIINRVRLEYEGLYPVLTIALVLFTFGVTTSLHGSGFLAVYVLGIRMNQKDFIHKHSLIQFHDGLAWLMQIVMFITLGLQVFPSRLPSVVTSGVWVAFFLIFIARPISVFVTLVFTRFNLREKLFISWVGLRGAAPIVLATFPLLAGVSKADTIFHLVFFIVLLSVLLQGTLVARIAKWLRVNDTSEQQSRSPLAVVMDENSLSNNLIEVTVSEQSSAAGKQVLDLHLPKDTLLILIGRAGDMVVPRGDTLIQVGDKILILTSEDAQRQVRKQLDSIG